MVPTVGLSEAYGGQATVAASAMGEVAIVTTNTSIPLIAFILLHPVDLSTETVTVLRTQVARRKAEKLRRGWREMPEPLFCTQAGTYPDPTNIRRAFAAVLKEAKLPSHFTPHGLRHTFASVAPQAGQDLYYVSRMLGHADIGLTVATYGSWPNPSRPGVLDALDRVAAQPATEAAS